MDKLGMPVTRCDIFCKVIDNFGDIGVCWRLARQLVAEHGLAVRLWVDDLASFGRLAPSIAPQCATQILAGVEVCRWDATTAQADPADIVIEAFACDPPLAYIEAMARRPRKPVWINLEYLSAEDWVEGCHALASPHPRLPLTRYFFFPGFTPKTGGLLREAALLPELRALQADAQAAAAWWARWADAVPPEGALKVSLFAYENASVGHLLDAWAQGAEAIFCAVPEGRILPQVQAWASDTRLHAGGGLRRGALTLRVLPFMPQDEYDRLLALCDLNFVRGEDSFVRAQWAGRPLVWHIYRQEAGAHLIKLNAFLERYVAGLSPAESAALHGFWQAWEAQAEAGQQWPALLAALPGLAAQARRWATKMEANGDLTSKLLIFCKDLLECPAL